MRLKYACLAALLTATMGLPLSAQDFTREEIKQLALQAILENPEIVMEAVTILQDREAAEADAAARARLDDSRDMLENDPNAPIIGNVDGSVTVVEFFDYNCPYCRRAGDEVEAVLALDDDVRVVYREWPILGEGSDFAARAALAARAQDMYPEMHKALMSARGRVDERSVMRIAEAVGLDIDRLKTDMQAPEVQAHIDTSMDLARSLGFSGTPSFVIGAHRAPGLIDAARMQELIQDVRDDG